MAYSKEKYKQLRELGGYSAKDANKYAYRSQANVKKLIESNILKRLDMGEKLKPSAKYHLAKFLGFKTDEATRLRGFSVKNFATAIRDHALPQIGNLTVSREKDGIKLISAYAKGMYQHKKYLYKVEYDVDIGFKTSKRYITVTSNDKLTNKQIKSHIINKIFPKHDEDYDSKPIKNSIRVQSAYYITSSEQRKLLKQRDDIINANKKTSPNNPRKE